MVRRIGLVAGVGHYVTHTQLPSLTSPFKDAQAIYDLLKSFGHFHALYPLPLADGRVADAGKVSAIELRARISEVLNPKDGGEVELALFYFSGHGVFDKAKQVVYLSASDEREAIALSWLVKEVRKSSVQNACIVLDCCHSGGVLDFTDFEHKGLCVIAASAEDGEALARPSGSLLTELLCEALTPSPEQALITSDDLIQRLRANLRNLPQQVLYLQRAQAFELTRLVVLSDLETKRPAWAGALSEDDYGLYAEVSVQGVTQGLRWIEDATQAAGGFWLADTACTQAFWQAVMKKNPATFKGEEHPVERVSWFMVHDFLVALNQQVAGLQARLPSEAEWALACAADSSAAHCQVQSTQAVKASAPDARGLYQMLGNVWEWCADAADESGNNRVLCGGCWASQAVSADLRGRAAAGNRDATIGFRWVV